jgi:TetR/AcrR family transcriptional repressor of nem operon
MKCIQQAVKEKELNNGVDPEKLAELILYSWEGAVLRIKVNGNYDSLHIFKEMLLKTILK